MKFTLNHTKEDLIEYQQVIRMRLRVLHSNGGLDFLYNFILWILIALFLLTSFSIYRDYDDVRGGVVYLVGYFIGIIVVVATMAMYNQKRFISKTFDSDGFFYSPKEIEFFDDRIIISSKYGTQEYLFSSIFGFLKSKRNFYLFIDNAQALLVPVDKIDDEFISSKLRPMP